MGALATIQEGNKCTEETKAKADVFLHQHIDEMLEFEYSNCDDPSTLWKDLEIRFNNQREVLLPSARDEWNNLRFQDFKKVNEYTSALFRICRTLRFCGQTVTEGDMLEKTFSTFHASNINLQQQYRLQNFKRYSDLNVNLLVAEKNNELLMKNHQSRPTGSLAIPEANAVNNNDNKNSGSKRGRGPQRRLGIYVGYEISSIIRYVEPLMGDVFTALFADCHFNEAIFPPLGREKKTHEKDVSWSKPSLLYLDPRTKQSETKVQKIMHLQEIANQLPDAFTDTKRATKSHIPAANAPARVEIPNKRDGDNIAQESQKHLKRGRPIGSKDKNPRKRKGTEKNSDHEENLAINSGIGQSFGHHKGACPWLTENHLLSGYVKQGLVNPLAPRKDMVIENQIQLICKVVNHRTDLENIFTKKPYASGLASAYVS
ncbi:hypothetical protein Tco_0926177 [Tanacetum coccineum]|uniref:Retrotransposon gag domain-containing protein n=1 Tax=Tanacetum coccineum TaxID=301880 RepID=A0ABQ5DBU2_9ASTR